MKNKQVRTEKSNKVWKILLGVSAPLFIVIGCALILLSNRYLIGIQYLSTGILFFASMYLVHSNKIDIQSSTPNDFTFFSFGFILTAVGLSFNILIWGLGVIIFIAGLFRMYTH